MSEKYLFNLKAVDLNTLKTYLCGTNETNTLLLNWTFLHLFTILLH